MICQYIQISKEIIPVLIELYTIIRNVVREIFARILLLLLEGGAEE